MSKNKKKNGCGCSFLWMNYWLPDFCFTQACNIHDIEIQKDPFEAAFNFLENMIYSIYQYGKYKILLSIIAIIYFIGVLLFGWIFYLSYKLKTINLKR